MEKINANRPLVTIGKPDKTGKFDVNISVRLFSSGKPLSNKELAITLNDEKLAGPENPINGDETSWKTNNNGFLEFGFKKPEGTYRISLWVEDQFVSLIPVKLDIPKLKDFQFTKPQEIKGNEGSYLVKFTCLDDKGNNSAGTIEFETQPNHAISVETIDEDLADGEWFSISVPQDGLSTIINSADGLPVILTLSERKSIVKTLEFPKPKKDPVEKATSFKLSSLKPNPLSDGSYVLRLDCENEGKRADGIVALITEPQIEVYDHESGEKLSETGEHGKPPEIDILGLGRYIRIKSVKPLEEPVKLEIHLLGTSYTKTVDLVLDKKNNRKPVKLAPTKWYPIDAKGTFCIPIALLDENGKAFGEKGTIYYSADLKTKAGLNKVSELKEIGIVGINDFEIPPEGANLIVQFEGRTCTVFIGLECGDITESIELY